MHCNKGIGFSQVDKANQINAGLEPLQNPLPKIPPLIAFFRNL